MAHLAVPAQMQALGIRRFGDLSVLEPLTLPTPEVGPDDVLIRVHIAGVGEWDAFEREGGYADTMPRKPRFPYVLGSEGSGVVAAVGANVARLAVGDEVYASAFLNPKGGFYAQYAAVAEDLVAHVPTHQTIEHAGVMSGVALTALRGLADTLQLVRGETLLIAGASGGIGHVAIQLAKRLGARVFAIASHADGVALAERVGADRAVDGRTPDVLTAARAFAPDGFDAALLAANGGSITPTLKTLRVGARIAYPTGVQPEPEVGPDIRKLRYNGEPDAEIIARFQRMVEAEPLHVHIAHTYRLAEAASAQRALADHHIGKLALRVE